MKIKFRIVDPMPTFETIKVGDYFNLINLDYPGQYLEKGTIRTFYGGHGVDPDYFNWLDFHGVKCSWPKDKIKFYNKQQVRLLIAQGNYLII